jgi:hypothetical protein
MLYFSILYAVLGTRLCQYAFHAVLRLSSQFLTPVDLAVLLVNMLLKVV